MFTMIPSLAAGVFIAALGKKIHLQNVELLFWFIWLVVLETWLSHGAVSLLIALFVSAPFIIKCKPYAKPLFRAAIVASSLLIYLNFGGW